MKPTSPEPQPPLQPATAVHQFHSGSAVGDAVTNSMFFTQRLLRQLGFESEIYVEHVAEQLQGRLRHYRQYRHRPGDVFLVHHSMGHDLLEWVLGLPRRKVLVYHNITPAHFFPPGSVVQRYARLGREQLALMRECMPVAIGDSGYNAQELRELDYPQVSVVPLLLDVAELRRAPCNTRLVEQSAGTFTVLFVGRVVENKCTHHVLEVFSHLVELLDRPAQLVLVGSYEEADEYYQRVRQQVRDAGLEGRVHFAGKVSGEDLYGWYRAADVFLCMSEHEGFGVPLIEAMLFDVPVVAYDSTVVAETLGGAGVLVKQKNFREIAGLLVLLSRDRALRRVLLEGQRRRVEDFSQQRLLEGLGAALRAAGVALPLQQHVAPRGAPELAVQVEGPFETSYSLALVNREMARALEAQQPGQVALFATEGPGDYKPRAEDLARHPELRPLWERGGKWSRARTVIRNLYPPRCRDARGLVNLQYFFWEESGLAPEWVTEFNRSLDGMLVSTQWVRKVLLDAGVHVPVNVVGVGTEHLLRAPAQRFRGALGRSFRFLHVSSAFPRKGIDVLLEAWGRAFTSEDDVTLVLKTFPNVHNTVEEQLHQARRRFPRFPDVVLINQELPAPMVRSLYEQCHAFVAPSRGEGYGLPMAEAMRLRLPVITTAWGGQADFCTEETAWLVDFQFAPARTHMGLFDSVWLEPDADSLARALREVWRAPAAERERKVEAALRLVRAEHSWERCAQRVSAVVDALQARPALAERRLRLGWVSSWNTRCGIASYSSFLLRGLSGEHFETFLLASRTDTLESADDDNVIRCWEHYSEEPLEQLRAAITAQRLDIVVIQFNFGFYQLRHLGALLDWLRERAITTVVMFHATQDVAKPDFKASLGELRRELAGAQRLLVHGVDDLNRLKQLGLRDNVTLFPQGMVDLPPARHEDVRKRLGLPPAAPVLATYGFLLPHKGLQELIRAMPAVLAARPDCHLLMVNALYPSPVSKEAHQQCLDAVRELGLEGRVTLVTDYLEDAQSLALLQAADLIVFPYQETAESSSAAVRFGLGARRPVACTPLRIFSDVAELVHSLPGTQAPQLAEGLVRLLEDSALRQSKAEAQDSCLRARAWPVLATRLGGLLRGLLAQGPSSTTREKGND